VQDGFELYADGRLITLFSAPNYCGEYDNAGAVMCVSADYTIDFKVLSLSLSVSCGGGIRKNKEGMVVGA
jgi:hypothetical protein